MTDRQHPEAPDDDTALDPASMLSLLHDQQDAIQRGLARFVPWILLAWAVAWGVGFGGLWLIDGARPQFAIPVEVAAPLFGALMAIAAVVSAVLGARSGRGIRSSKEAAFTGTVYGITWSVGFIALFVLGSALSYNGMPSELSNLYYPAVSLIFVGIMYVIAGAIWRAIPAIVMGGLIVFIAAIGPYFGYPGHYLFYAITGGGVFLAGTVVTAVYSRKIRLKGLA